MHSFFYKSAYLISLFVNIIIFIVGGKAVIDGAITIGSYTIIVTYFSFIMSALKYFFGLGGQTQATLVSLDRLNEITDRKVLQEGEIYDDEIKEIRLENISFSYDSEPIFHNYSQVFSRGKVYAVTGENGKGKSTLLKLLSGLYTEEMQGEIYINSKAIGEYNMKKMRGETISFCEQDSVLLSGDLYDNLFIHETGQVDESKYLELRKILNLESILPPCLDSLKEFFINEKSSNLSGGERQKLALMRSLFPSAQLFLLDEPTASLDMATKHRLMEYIDKIKQHSIIVMVTHEAELTKKADIFISLDKIQ